jgi:hypothetical protein
MVQVSRYVLDVHGYSPFAINTSSMRCGNAAEHPDDEPVPLSAIGHPGPKVPGGRAAQGRLRRQIGGKRLWRHFNSRGPNKRIMMADLGTNPRRGRQ